MCVERSEEWLYAKTHEIHTNRFLRTNELQTQMSNEFKYIPEFDQNEYVQEPTKKFRKNFSFNFNAQFSHAKPHTQPSMEFQLNNHHSSENCS